MNKNLFCFQCEQTAGCAGCTGAAGVCGKTARTGLLQDALTGALIGLARASESSADLLTPETDALIQQALFACVTNVSFEDGAIQDLFAMTPYYWKTGPQAAQRLETVEGFSTEIDFDFLLYQRQ